jgi:Na+-translocating ferredoxin:NAD+ oxidoreductase RnfG subunit
VKETMINTLKFTILCLISALLISVIYFFLIEKINQNDIELEQNSNYELSLRGVKFVKNILSKEDNSYYYVIKDKNDNLIGYSIVIYCDGYNGKIKLMVSYNSDLLINNMKILNNHETPGYKELLDNQIFKNIFINTNSTILPIPVSKSMISSDSQIIITGSTISFNGISNKIKKSTDLLTKIIKG